MNDIWRSGPANNPRFDVTFTCNIWFVFKQSSWHHRVLLCRSAFLISHVLESVPCERIGGLAFLDRDRMLLGKFISIIWGLCNTHYYAVCLYQCVLLSALWSWLMLTETSSRETLTRGVALERHSDGSGRWDHQSPLSTNSLEVSGFWLSAVLTAT